MTAEELQTQYRQILLAGAVRMLDEVMARFPGTITKQEFGDAAGIAIAGGTFSTYLGDLARHGLVERHGDDLRATGILMNGATR